MRNLNTSISNWNQVLSSYVAETQQATALFSDETIRYLNVLKQFQQSFNKDDFQNNELSAEALFSAENANIPNLVLLPELLILADVIDSLPNYCSAGSVADSYMSSVCSDFGNNFDSTTLSNLNTVLDGWCTQILTPDDSSNVDSVSSSAPESLQKKCLKRSSSSIAYSISDLAQVGSSTSSYDLFGFLKDNTTLLTFGASSETVLSWYCALYISALTSLSLIDSTTLMLGFHRQLIRARKEKISAIRRHLRLTLD